MPNIRGGKKYKSGKQTETEFIFHDVNAEEGQTIGRVIKSLGDRNMLIFCNDGKERICHIRGGLSKKKAYIEIGDIVLISLRNENMQIQNVKKDKGDILAKYEREQHHLLKKMDWVNGNLFLNIETIDGKARANGMTPSENADGFEFDYSSDEGVDDEGQLTGQDPLQARESRKTAEEKKRSVARTVKQRTIELESGGDVDIDAI